MQAIPIPVLFPIPTDEDDFEDLCVDLLRLYWTRPGLERYGAKGQRQHGIDILDLKGVTPLHAAQCKLREFGKKLSPDDIEAEVNKARGFGFSLGKYGILTTAKVSTQAQDKVLEINQHHSKTGQFEIELLTWGTLCRLLQRYDEVRTAYFEHTVITGDSRIGSKSPIVLEAIQEAGQLSIPADLTSQIDEARDAINRREYQLGFLLLNRIQQHESFDRATDHDKFRIFSNLAVAEIGLRKFEVAADHFFAAALLEPEDERARINEVFAHILRGESETAFSKATALRNEYPGSTKLATNWITSSPLSMRLVDLEAELSEEIRADAEVALALSKRALLELKIETTLFYADRAATGLPASSQPPLIIARANMGWLVQANKGVPIPDIERSELERRVEEEIAKSIRFAEAENDPHTQSEALALKTDLRISQKRLDEAEVEANEALRLDPDNLQPLLALSHLRGTAKRIDESIQLLDRAHRKGGRPEAAVMYARALLQRRLEDDVENAIALLRPLKLSELRPEFRHMVVSTAVDAFVSEQKFEEARKYLSDTSGEVRPEVIAVLQGHIAFVEGNQSLAETLATEARSGLTEDSGPETKEFVARLLVRLGKLEEALPLFQELFDLKIDAFEWGQLLDCAARLHRDDVVINTCAELKRRGIDPWDVVSFEVQYVQKYSREKAVGVLDEFLKTHPGHKLALLCKSVIGVQSHQPALVAGDVDQLPTVEELPLDYIVPAVHVLRFARAADAAVDYAYRFLRLHFEDIRAHHGVMASFIPPDPSITIPPTQDKVDIGSAVEVYDDFNNVARWFVIENTDKPNPAFEEIAADGMLAKELLGKRVKDPVILAKGQIESRTGTIRQIMPKYVRRFHDVLGEMGVRFGDKSAVVESVRIGTTEAETAKALQKILDSVKRRENAASQLRKVYDEGPVSLHMFGDQFGDNAYVALASLAQESGQFVKCSLGTPDERAQSTFALQTAANVVVDITAVATVRLVGIEKLLLENKRFHFQMTEGTFNELQDTLIGDLFSGATSATLSHRNGVASMTEETADQKAVRRARDEDFLDRLKAAVEIVPVIELSTMEPSKREPFEQMFGQYGSESILLARHSDSILWTDDLIQAEIAKNEFGIRRTWSELVAEQSAIAGELSPDERQLVLASLIGMEYTSIFFDSTVLLKAVEIAEATPWKTPFKQFVEVFRKPTGNLQGLLGMFMDFIVKLYREPYLPETRCKIVVALLDALWATVPLRLALLRLRKASVQFFGLNTVGQQQFDACFDNWYAERPDKLLSK
jgi:tetratricopeptide (TPR) repeat protein